MLVLRFGNNQEWWSDAVFEADYLYFRGGYTYRGIRWLALDGGVIGQGEMDICDSEEKCRKRR